MKKTIARSVVLALAILTVSCDQTEAPAAVSTVRIGFMSVSATPSFIEGLKQGLLEQGLVEGENLEVDWRVLKSRGDLDGVALELVERPVDVIVAGGTRAARAAMKFTDSIPIVMTNSGDPVRSGLVKSLAEPGGNVTGLTQASPKLTAKRIEILLETVPSMDLLGVLWNPDHPNTPHMFKEAVQTADAIGIEIVSLEVHGEEDIRDGFAKARAEGAGAMLVLRDPLMVEHAEAIADAAIVNRLPAMYETRNFLTAGGLMLYGPSFEDLYRRSASFVKKVLTGTPPRDLPIEQPVTFELVINEPSAEAIGLELPQAIVLRATSILRSPDPPR